MSVIKLIYNQAVARLIYKMMVINIQDEFTKLTRYFGACWWISGISKSIDFTTSPNLETPQVKTNLG